VCRQTGQRTQKLTIGRQDQQIATTHGPHQRQRIVGARVVRQHQARTGSGVYASHSQRDSEAPQSAGRRLRQAERANVALEACQRLTQVA